MRNLRPRPHTLGTANAIAVPRGIGMAWPVSYPMSSLKIQPFGQSVGFLVCLSVCLPAANQSVSPSFNQPHVSQLARQSVIQTSRRSVGHACFKVRSFNPPRGLKSCPQPPLLTGLPVNKGGLRVEIRDFNPPPLRQELVIC